MDPGSGPTPDSMPLPYPDQIQIGIRLSILPVYLFLTKLDWLHEQIIPIECRGDGLPRESAQEKTEQRASSFRALASNPHLAGALKHISSIMYTKAVVGNGDLRVLVNKTVFFGWYEDENSPKQESTGVQILKPNRHIANQISILLRSRIAVTIKYKMKRRQGRN